MDDISIEVQGIEELDSKIDSIIEKIKAQLSDGLEMACQDTAENIKSIYTGGRVAPGFKDRTGALRSSIKGGIEDNQPEGQINGFVSAGDDSIGTDGKTTREYVSHVEFGEFAKAGNTSFLRAGVQTAQRNIATIIKNSIDLEAVVK